MKPGFFPPPSYPGVPFPQQQVPVYSMPNQPQMPPMMGVPMAGQPQPMMPGMVPMQGQMPMKPPGMVPLQAPLPGFSPQKPGPQFAPVAAAPPQYAPQPVIPSHAGPTKEKYAWAPRSEKMKWAVAESIDVEQIVRKGDLTSVLFYMDQFVSANITKEDIQNFGSKGALNAFLVMQLGVDYLLNQKQRLEAEAAAQQPANAEMDAKHVEQYNMMVEAATKEIQARDAKIHEYEKRFKQMHEERRKAKALLEKYRKKFRQLKGGGGGGKKKRTAGDTYESEPGALHDETAYRELKLLQQQQAMGSVAKPKKKPGKDWTDTAPTLSEGEIETGAIAGHVTQATMSDGEESGYYDDSQEEETGDGNSDLSEGEAGYDDDEY